ncbi:KEOPS complex subunit Cgi121 [Methanobacterium sp. ACI-7]|uniref:KEOPS complex subunit Cgi121 n=1 Tax=unclassified Methanobacterium TaxID=2627676 RepID=UPI0039C4AC75
MKSNEYDIQIAGFKHNVTDFRKLVKKADEISKKCTLQLLDADGIAGYEHIIHATVHAINAFKRNENIAKDLGLEICVRASAQRQISKALDILGMKEGQMNLCLVAVDCNEGIMDKVEEILDKKDDEVLIPDENKLKTIYGISDSEINAAGNISKIMMEKTTLLVLGS